MKHDRKKGYHFKKVNKELTKYMQNQGPKKFFITSSENMLPRLSGYKSNRACPAASKLSGSFIDASMRPITSFS